MTSSASSESASCGVSHVGLVRPDNQDAILMCDPEHHATAVGGHLYAIADGMGGYEHGALASAKALEILSSTFYHNDSIAPLPRLRQGINEANLAIVRQAQQMGARMGTTLTAIYLDGHQAHIAHIGDTRAYLIRRDRASCLTSDHTLVGDLVRMRVLTPDQVRTHTQRSVLNRCLGLGLFVQPDTSQVRLESDDLVVLCSDGVWSVIQDDEFATVAAKTLSLHALAQRLVELAMERQSDDNLSVIAINPCACVAQATQTTARRQWRLPRLFGFNPNHG